jgi:hypothetical protein
VPELFGDDSKTTQLQPDQEGSLYQLGYAIIDLQGENGVVEYFQYDPADGNSTSMFKEELG